jgi:hypothetical protein
METREVVWRSEDGMGAEYLFLTRSEAGYIADSIVFATREVAPSRTRYRADLDLNWNIRGIALAVSNAGAADRTLALRSDGTGHWRDAAGSPLPEFDGCRDIDISATPFTNTLPIRRLDLRPGQVEAIRVLFIQVPSLHIEPDAQRYTGLGEGRVRFESVDGDFQRDLAIDDDGLVVDYPGLFRMVWSR